MRCFIPPQSVRKNAQKVLDWRNQYPNEIKGMTRTGWIRANQLAKGKCLSQNIVKRIYKFKRHEKNSTIPKELKQTPWKDAGNVAWLGWGGDEAILWAKRKRNLR